MLECEWNADVTLRGPEIIPASAGQIFVSSLYRRRFRSTMGAAVEYIQSGTVRTMRSLRLFEKAEVAAAICLKRAMTGSA
jgi:hypothetical protein